MFPTIVFGSIVITSPGNATYTHGSSISAGGYRLFIVPTVPILGSSINMGFTYRNQFGQLRIYDPQTSITTTIAGGTTSGTHVPVVLEPGDVGVQDIIGVTINVGGTTGNTLNFESWNEGSGVVPAPVQITQTFDRDISQFSPPYPYDLLQSNLPDPIRSSQSHLAKYTFYSSYELRDITISNIVPSQIPFTLTPETIEPDYEFEVNDFGFMQPITLVTKYNNLKKLRIELIPNQNYQYLDANEQSTRLKWKWDPSLSQYDDIGFYKLTFDYDVKFNRTNFVFELLDKDGAIVWSTPTGTGTGPYTGTGTNQVVSFKSFSWEFRLMCKANYTTPSTTTDHAQVTNIRIERYKDQGAIALTYGIDVTNIDRYDRIEDTITVPPGTSIDTQLAFSDDNTSYGTFSGYDGTGNTYYTDNTSMMITVPPGYTGYYFKWRTRLLSDGRYTPTLFGLSIFAYCKNMSKLINTLLSPPSFYPDANPQITVPVPIGKAYIYGVATDQPFSRGIVSKYFINIRGNRVQYKEEPIGARTFNGRAISSFSSWLESVVGQVTSGYVTNINDEIIRNAFNVVIMSTERTDVNPLGVTTTAIVNPNTGLYQIFLKKVIYDKRYVMIKIGLKNVVLEGTGIPTSINGNLQLPSPYNLQFGCPTVNCDFDITRDIA